MNVKNIIDVIQPDELDFMDTLSLNSGEIFYFEYNNEIHYSDLTKKNKLPLVFTTKAKRNKCIVYKIKNELRSGWVIEGFSYGDNPWLYIRTPEGPKTKVRLKQTIENDFFIWEIKNKKISGKLRYCPVTKRLTFV